MTYFDELKKKQQYQRGKYIYFSFRSELWPNDYSTISNLVRLPSQKYFGTS